MPRRPTPPDAAERERIILATLNVIAEAGISNAKLATIAERAGIAYGTLYRHFEDRDTLLLAAMMRQADDVKQAWESASNDGGVIDRLVDLGTAPLLRSAADPHSRELYMATLLAGPSVVPKAGELVRSMTDFVLSKMLESIEEAKALGYFDGLASDVLAVTILGISQAYISTLVVSEEPNWPQVIPDVEALIRRLAGTPKRASNRRATARPRGR
jgi:AcrR family transcriptional regulator